MVRPKSFVVNLRHNEIFVIDTAGIIGWSHKDYAKIVTIFLQDNDFRKSYGCVISVDKIAEDWPTIPFRTNIMRSFRGFEDILMIAN